MRSDLLKAVAVTAELCGRTFSEAAARVFVADLEAYPEHQVLGALKRCRREVKGALTVADVVSRLDDGRPGAEEAWAMIPRDEASTVVWTGEMAAAYGIAAPLLSMGDHVAARMAFREAYTAAVAAARERGDAPHWQASLGWDVMSRASAIKEAIEMGRLPATAKVEYIGHSDVQIVEDVAKRLTMG